MNDAFLELIAYVWEIIQETNEEPIHDWMKEGF